MPKHKKTKAEELAKKRADAAFKKRHPKPFIVPPGAERALVEYLLKDKALQRKATIALKKIGPLAAATGQPVIASVVQFVTPEQNRNFIRTLLRTRMDAIGRRIRLSNSAGIKADGTEQENLTQREIADCDLDVVLRYIAIEMSNEESLAQELLPALRREKIWTEWLSKQEGVGPIAAAFIIAFYDIRIAATVSKLWQYGGMNSAMKHGKQVIAVSAYKPADGTVLKTLPADKEKGKPERYVVETNILIRGDKLTKGFLSPFNGELRVGLLGIMGPNMLKAESPWAKFYYARHIPEAYRKDKDAMLARPDLAGRSGTYDASEGLVAECPGRGQKPVMVMWKDARDGHQHRAAIRYMVKEFLKDLYVAWRTLEGLPVRAPYQEEKLGHKHGVAAKTP